ncbi:MAG: VOC family protein [Steroidobacteraceae bacterium]|jgi:catechol 2,3-dioxygenase-like lactoylglutathione lyase family enzyme
MSLVTPLKRTAIIVTDMKKSLRFYRDVLGLNVWVQGKMGKEVPAIFRLLGAPPGTVRWVILQSEDVDWGMVGLFELRRPSPPRVRPRTLAQANAGEACLVFHTPDVDAVHRGAKRLKLRILCPPTLLEIAERQVLSKEMTLRDPNGVLVNFIQNVRAGTMTLSNRFPGLRSVSNARKAALRKRRSGASSRRRSG